MADSCPPCPDTTSTPEAAMEHLRRTLEATPASWTGWDALDGWLAALSTLAQARIDAREIPWRHLRAAWREALDAPALPQLWSGTPPTIPDDWRGDLTRAEPLVASLREACAQGVAQLDALASARDRAARKTASSALDAIDSAIAAIMHDAQSLFPAVVTVGPPAPRVSEPAPAPPESLPAPRESAPSVRAPPPGPSRAPRRSGPRPPPRTEAPSLLPSAVPAPMFESEPPPLPLAPGVPAALVSYEAFRESFWIDPTGACADAPWNTVAFAAGLREAMGALLEADTLDWRWLRLQALSAERLGLRDLLWPSEVAELDALWRRPESLGPRAMPPRTDLLRRARNDATIQEHPAWRWRLALEALRPHRDHPLSAEEFEDGCELAGMREGPLRALLRGVAALNEGGEDGAAVVRRAWRAREDVDGAKTTEALTEARTAFHREITTRWSAAGGSIMTTHSRETWARFMEALAPSFKRLYPPDHGGLASLDADTERAWVETLPREHARVADRGGVKRGDRARGDRTVDRIAALATRVLDLAERVGAQRVRRVERPEVLPCCEALAALATDASPMARLLRATLNGLDARIDDDGDAFFDSDVQAAPWLLRYVDVAESLPRAGLRFDLAGIRDPRRAVAAALAAGTSSPPVADSPTLLARWLEANGRPALVAPLLPALDPTAQQRAHLRRQQWIARLDARVDDFDRTCHQLADLAAPSAHNWRLAARDAAAWLHPDDDTSTRTLPHDLTLFEAWIERASALAKQTLDGALASLRDEARARDPEVAQAVDAALTRRRYADALHLLDHRGSAEEPERPRATLWRWEAVGAFARPREALASMDDATEFAEAWLAGLASSTNPANSNRRLRTLFRDLMLQGLEVPSDPHELRVECQRVRRWLASQGHNPSALPQLTSAASLVVVTPTLSPTHPSFVQELAAQVSAYPNDFVIALCPGVTAEVRARTLTELRNRRYRAAVFDDLDLCRLLNPGGARPTPVLALMELLLEQQRWTEVSPFSLSDGQSVQLEMYFGRADEARLLSRERGISRLFSGRKLGKSALLRFVEQTGDGQRLPSGNALRVIYVSAAGVDREPAMVAAILGKLSERCGTDADDELPGEEPRKRLERVLGQHLRAHPQESLLFFLDEADVFVEQQVRAYAEHRENILSFTMRSIETAIDAASLPRVRFVFTGYRVTHTTRGAWANWGDVLRLRPLDAVSAADLLARPLARLGIQMGDQGRAVAHRCGYQPAVLLRFGQRLLARLEETHPRQRRDHAAIVVTPQDVAEVFDSDDVRNEIVQVTKNNFQGNETGEIVHAVVLQEFLNLPPGRALPDAGAAVLARLERLSEGDLGWFVPEGSTAEAEVAHHLRDLVDRQLLVRRGADGATVTCALRFPHLLPVLMHLADERQVRTHIELRRKAAPSAAGTPPPEGALPERVLEELREHLVGEESDVLRVVPIVASHWLTPLTDGRVGLADRLGLSAREVCDLHLGGAADRAPRLLLSASPRNARAELTRRLPDDAPVALVGGADLLRWCLTLAARPDELGPDVLVEPFTDGRWSFARVRWWFQRVRTFEFEPADALDHLYHRTGGIPLLLRDFDVILRDELGKGDGETLTASEWRRCLAAFDATLPRTAARLRDGDDTERLTPRERELLAMLAVVRDAATPQAIAEHLSEPTFWDYYRASVPYEPVAPDEWSHVDLLQRLGLVRVSSRHGRPQERLALTPPDDALHALLAHLRG